MCKLSKRQHEIFEGLLGAVPSVVAINLKITEHNIDVVVSNVRRKEAKAKKFLRDLKKYKRILHPPPKYKGV